MIALVFIASWICVALHVLQSVQNPAEVGRILAPGFRRSIPWAVGLAAVLTLWLQPPTIVRFSTMAALVIGFSGYGLLRTRPELILPRIHWIETVLICVVLASAPVALLPAEFLLLPNLSYSPTYVVLKLIWPIGLILLMQRFPKVHRSGAARLVLAGWTLWLYGQLWRNGLLLDLEALGHTGVAVNVATLGVVLAGIQALWLSAGLTALLFRRALSGHVGNRWHSADFLLSRLAFPPAAPMATILIVALAALLMRGLQHVAPAPSVLWLVVAQLPLVARLLARIFDRNSGSSDAQADSAAQLTQQLSRIEILRARELWAIPRVFLFIQAAAVFVALMVVGSEQLAPVDDGLHSPDWLAATIFYVGIQSLAIWTLIGIAAFWLLRFLPETPRWGRLAFALGTVVLVPLYLYLGRPLMHPIDVAAHPQFPKPSVMIYWREQHQLDSDSHEVWGLSVDRHGVWHRARLCADMDRNMHESRLTGFYVDETNHSLHCVWEGQWEGSGGVPYDFIQSRESRGYEASPSDPSDIESFRRDLPVASLGAAREFQRSGIHYQYSATPPCHTEQGTSIRCGSDVLDIRSAPRHGNVPIDAVLHAPAVEFGHWEIVLGERQFWCGHLAYESDGLTRDALYLLERELTGNHRLAGVFGNAGEWLSCRNLIDSADGWLALNTRPSLRPVGKFVAERSLSPIPVPGSSDLFQTRARYLGRVDTFCTLRRGRKLEGAYSDLPDPHHEAILKCGTGEALDLTPDKVAVAYGANSGKVVVRSTPDQAWQLDTPAGSFWCGTAEWAPATGGDTEFAVVLARVVGNDGNLDWVGVMPAHRELADCTDLRWSSRGGKAGSLVRMFGEKQRESLPLPPPRP